jgi:hypothetical protein
MDSAVERAAERLRAAHVATVEIRQVFAGVRSAREEIQWVKLPLAVTCDWGDCDEQADYLRHSYDLGYDGWLPVCERHRLPPSDTYQWPKLMAALSLPREPGGERCVICGEEGEFEDGLRCKMCTEADDG